MSTCRERIFGLYLALVGSIAILAVMGGFGGTERVDGQMISYLTYVTDTLSNTHPASTTNHTIRFTLAQAIPPSGSIVVDFSGGGFVIPGALNFSDVDISSSPTRGGPYSPRPVSSIATGGTDGVTFTPGSAGALRVDINTIVGIPAGHEVEIKIGTNATVGFPGDVQTTLSSATGSYPIVIETFDASDVRLDYSETRIYIIEQVTAGPVDTTDETAPVIVRAEPSGILQAGTVNVELLVETNEISTCRYATSSGIPYASMPVQFTATTGILSLLHTSPVNDIVASTTYNFYLNCIDFRGNSSSSDYVLSFIVGIPPGSASTTATSTDGLGDGGAGSASSTGTGTNDGDSDSGEGTGPGTTGITGGGGGGGSSGGGGPDGGEYLHQSEVRIDGYAYPGAEVVILQDGEEVSTKNANGDAAFDERIEELERGTYTFSMYAIDDEGNKSAAYSTTIALRSDTINQLADIMLPPTVILDATSIDPGAPLNVRGYTAPDAEITLAIRPRVGVVSTGDVVATTTAAGDGTWSLTLSTDELAVGTYNVTAEAMMPDGTVESDKSATRVLGIGQEVGDIEGDGLRADLNRDTFVNLIDFSILLFNWNTTDAVADINEDGIVDLTDFSIMIFYWTG